MKSIFNCKLYIQGLRKIRLVGIISAIIVLLGNLLYPVHVLTSGADASYYGKNILTFFKFAPGSFLILAVTPFCLLSMFGFLNKRRESDFYHALPFKRSCVFFSFSAAVLTWLWGILLASLLLNTLLWAICPTVVFSASLIPQIFAVYAVGTLYIAGFGLLAMSLSGTVVSNFAVAGILFFLVRTVAYLFSYALEELAPMLDITYTPMRILSMRYWYPITLLLSTYDPSVLHNSGLWVYTGSVILLLFAAATFFFCRRKSEIAGKSAPSRRLQHVFRCAFTLPAALLCAIAILVHGGEGFFFLLLLTLGAYFLYELITAKNLRSAAKCAPFIAIPIACAVLFGVGVYGISESVLHESYSLSDLRSVRFYEYRTMYDILSYEGFEYERIATMEAPIESEEAKELVLQALKDTSEIAQGKFSRPHIVSMEMQNVEITLSSGRKIGRLLRFEQEALKTLRKIMETEPAYKQAYLSLPETDEIDTIYLFDYDVTPTEQQCRMLWTLFSEEYQALSDAEKEALKRESSNTHSWDLDMSRIGGFGTRAGRTYSFNYSIPVSFVKTYAYIRNEVMKDQEKQVDAYLHACADGTIRERYDDLRAAGVTTLYFQADGTECWIQISLNNSQPDFEQNIAKQQEFISILLPHLTKETNGALCRVRFHLLDDANAKYQGYYLYGLTPFSEEERAHMESICSDCFTVGSPET